MFIKRDALLALQASSIAQVSNPLPQAYPALEAAEHLSDIARLAYERASEDSSSGFDLQRRQNTCSWKDIKVRREW